MITLHSRNQHPRALHVTACGCSTAAADFPNDAQLLDLGAFVARAIYPEMYRLCRDCLESIRDTMRHALGETL